MANIAKEGDTVKVHYKAKANDQLIFDSKNTESLNIKIGENQVIPAFEKALIGMCSGQNKSISVTAEDAFGPYMEELISTIKRSDIPPHLKLKKDQQMQIQQPDGSLILVTVLDVNEKEAVFDANHPLAGKNINFDIELLEIIG